MKVLTDQLESWTELSRQVKAHGMVCNFLEAEIENLDGGVMVRQWVSHPGSVAIIALDTKGRVAVVHQYRHPVQMRLVEPPAGLLDVTGEDPLDAAKRELAEEVGLAAESWFVLADLMTSPGGSAECLRIYLAQGLSEAERPDGFELLNEESDMGLDWVPLENLVALIRAGKINNIGIVTGVMTLAFALATNGLSDLRLGSAPWLARDVVVR